MAAHHPLVRAAGFILRTTILLVRRRAGTGNLAPGVTPILLLLLPPSQAEEIRITGNA
jgi:hypothetical protein